MDYFIASVNSIIIINQEFKKKYYGDLILTLSK